MTTAEKRAEKKGDPPSVTTLPDIIRLGVRQFGSKQALAEKLDINATRLSRLAHHSNEYSLNIENCLRLAQLTQTPASDVLRAAGKGEIADLIEALYGEGRSHAQHTEATAEDSEGQLQWQQHEAIFEAIQHLIAICRAEPIDLFVRGDRSTLGTNTPPEISPKVRTPAPEQSQRTAAPVRRQTPRTGPR